jgi:sigma-B regulation protein RsbU (phosphoserine phosphatase)
MKGVTDTPANIQVVRDILKDSYNTRIATNGAKALDLAKASPQPDLILLDVMLPDLDGYEVCSQGYVSFRNLPTLTATAID